MAPPETTKVKELHDADEGHDRRLTWLTDTVPAERDNATHVRLPPRLVRLALSLHMFNHRL